jgi:hypothetical protein
VFHVARLDPAEAEELFARSGLQIEVSEAHEVGEFRSNHFFRLTPS